MDLAALANTVGDDWTLMIGGGAIGLLFGAFAQQSRFCLRSAVIEFAHGDIGEKTAVWLLVFTIAVAGTGLLDLSGVIAVTEARQLASPQSLSGAAVGGLMFGAGMVLARGCASRLLVLSATGNLRALVSGLVFAVVAQASLHGMLSPVRDRIAALAITAAGGGNDLVRMSGIGTGAAVAIACMAAVAAIGLALYRRLPLRRLVFACLVGACIPAAWWFTYTMSGIAFEAVRLEAISFTGPSADALMRVLNRPGTGLDFDTGLVPGVFLGAFIAAALTGELRLQGFEGGAPMRRYLVGAALMGFGGMLAGGCAVGAGVTGASVFALTAWITLFAIWLSAGLTDWLVDRGAAPALPAATPVPRD
ncbi:sulfur transporter [Hoeflea marina]|uniref:Sulfur transporter n=1 Tax=Hoeflea marina TaxID=274592 RepID=A0A317PRK2_9HYPH|nr:YeeE/YedE family protein [Hoeflea marina]PWW04091.1 sulfur transporter [Hoeflea marina]